MFWSILSSVYMCVRLHDINLIFHVICRYNLPISMTPFHSTAKCATAGCVSDLNKMCPAGMAVRDGAAGNR